MSKSNPGVTAYLEQLREFYQDPDCMAKNPPTPPTFEVAMDVAAACANAIALVLDYQKSGPITSMEPTPESRLKAAELIAAFEEGEYQ